MLILPSSNNLDYTQTVVLDGVGYDIRLQFNPREVSWYMYFGAAGQRYSVKTKVVNGFDILKPFKYLDNIPKGNLYLIDSVATEGRVGKNNFKPDDRFSLVYVTEEELA